MIFPPHHKTPEFIKPSKQTLDLPAASVVSEFAPVLSCRALTVSLVGRNQLNSAIFTKSLIELVAVVCLVANDYIRRIWAKAAANCILNKFHFVGRSAFNVSGDRKTRYVCDRHDLGAFAELGLADSKTPFFAGTKLPSMNASRISMPPRSYRSSTNSMAMRLKMPSLTHC